MYEDFHGARDFYSLIKEVSHEITTKKIVKSSVSEGNYNQTPTKRNSSKLTVDEVVLNAIERNFGGLPEAVNMMKESMANNFSSFRIQLTN